MSEIEGAEAQALSTPCHRMSRRWQRLRLWQTAYFCTAVLCGVWVSSRTWQNLCWKTQGWAEGKRACVIWETCVWSPVMEAGPCARAAILGPQGKLFHWGSSGRMASNITLSFWALTFLYDLSVSFTLGDQLFFQFTSQPFPKAQASPRSTGLGPFPTTVTSKTHLLPLLTRWILLGRYLLKPIQNTMFWLYPFLRSVDPTSHLLHNQGEPLKWKKSP